MFDFLFHHHEDLAHNKSKVKQWTGEHKVLAEEATAVVSFYEKGDFKKAKKHLVKLQSVALKHLMDEDVTFSDLMHKSSESEEDQEIVDSMKAFRKTFVDTKKALIHFFIHYTSEDVVLAEKFKMQLDGIINALVQRIEYEESNLYTKISK